MNAAGPDIRVRRTEIGQDILIIIGEDLKKEALDRRVREKNAAEPEQEAGKKEFYETELQADHKL